MNSAYAVRRLARELSVVSNSAPGDKRIFTKKEQGGWGRSWYFIKHSADDHGTVIGTVAGHLTPLPRAGDEFHSEMSSGKTGIFVVKSVRYCVDPHDMFFAEVWMTGYRHD
jgi:hypothetical protein